MMPDPCEDATSATRLVSVISLLLLPTGVTVKNIGADGTIPSNPVSFSKAWLLTWRHRTLHSLFVASSKKKCPVEAGVGWGVSYSSEVSCQVQKGNSSFFWRKALDWGQKLFKTTHWYERVLKQQIVCSFCFLHLSSSKFADSKCQPALCVLTGCRLIAAGVRVTIQTTDKHLTQLFKYSQNRCRPLQQNITNATLNISSVKCWSW